MDSWTWTLVWGLWGERGIREINGNGKNTIKIQ